MKNEFIPYEQAEELKELGFDNPCFAYYTGAFNEDVMIKEMPHCVISAPSFSQAFRWFRENYWLFTEIHLDRTTEPKFCFYIYKYEPFGYYHEIKPVEWYLYKTPEEAELDCLKELIKIAKKK